MNIATRTKPSVTLYYLCIAADIFSGVLPVQSLAISVPVSVPSVPVSSTPNQTNSNPNLKPQTEYEKYIDALLQSTGLKPPNPEFLETYYDRLYGEVNVNAPVSALTSEKEPESEQEANSKFTPSLPDPLPQPLQLPLPHPHPFHRPHPLPGPITLPPTPRRFTLPPSPTWRSFPYPFPVPLPNQNRRCVCVGCMVNGECIECLNESYCRRIEGTYCED